MGFITTSVWFTFAEDSKRKETRGTTNHFIAEQSSCQRTQLRHSEQTKTGNVEAPADESTYKQQSLYLKEQQFLHLVIGQIRQIFIGLLFLQEAVQPIGRFIPPDDVGMPSTSGADLNNVDL